jgi:hypothetical protein
VASTYSITLSSANHNVGNPSHKALLPSNYQLEDAFATLAAQTRAMSTNSRVQVKRPDGQLRYYTIDSSRSDPSKNLVFLLPVN